MYKHSFTLKSEFDGRSIPVTEIAADRPRFVVQILHGMAEHRARYVPFMEYIADHGGVLVASDHRGHGENAATPDDLCFFGDDGVEAALADVHTVGNYLREKYPTLPFILMGHSMGTLIARAYAAEHDELLDGMLLTGEASNNPAVGAGLFLTRLIALFRTDRYRSPMIYNLTIGSYDRALQSEADTDPLKGALLWLSADADNRRRYMADPLCGKPFTLNGFAVLFSFMKRTYAPQYWNVRHRDMPILFLSGEKDPVMTSARHFDAAVRFLRDMGYKNVSGKLYPGMHHEILQETDRLSVYGDIAAFLEEFAQKESEEEISDGM